MFPTADSDPSHILFCGDAHGHLNHVIDVVEKLRPRAIVLLGDIEAPAPLDVCLAPILPTCRVYWILGNHDTDAPAHYDALIQAKHHNIQRISGQVARVPGSDPPLTLAGLDGVFRTKIWAPDNVMDLSENCAHGLTQAAYVATMGKGNRWRDGMPLRHRSTIFPNQILDLSKLRTHILVTHEAPGCHPHGFRVLGDLARTMGASHSFHGHHHTNVDYGVIEGVHTRGVGIRSVMNLAGEVLVDGTANDAIPSTWVGTTGH